MNAIGLRWDFMSREQRQSWLSESGEHNVTFTYLNWDDLPKAVREKLIENLGAGVRRRETMTAEDVRKVDWFNVAKQRLSDYTVSELIQIEIAAQLAELNERLEDIALKGSE